MNSNFSVAKIRIVLSAIATLILLFACFQIIWIFQKIFWMLMIQMYVLWICYNCHNDMHVWKTTPLACTYKYNRFFGIAVVHVNNIISEAAAAAVAATLLFNWLVDEGLLPLSFTFAMACTWKTSGENGRSRNFICTCAAAI